MTCNFRNSAGTDLDSLFTVNNGNAGAIGFKISDGTDLGNRFASGSLGYNVGYKNSAGTDIGYLRGKVVAPSISGLSVSFINKQTSTGSQYDDTDEDWITTYKVNANLQINVTDANGLSMTSVVITLTTEDYAESTISDVLVRFERGSTIKNWSYPATTFTPNSSSFSDNQFLVRASGFDGGASDRWAKIKVTVTATNSAGSTTVSKTLTLSYN